jgi:hypothetical protein
MISGAMNLVLLRARKRNLATAACNYRIEKRISQKGRATERYRVDLLRIIIAIILPPLGGLLAGRDR